MRRVFCIVALLFIGGYLYAIWSDWFTRVELQRTGKRPLFSETIDVAKPGSITWLVPKEDWPFREGEGRLSLSLNAHNLPEIPMERTQLALRAKVKAEGRRPSGDWNDRSIRNRYFTTDEPFTKDARIWETYGCGGVEYGLAGIDVRDDEELRVTLDIQVPDGYLMRGYPRLKLVGAFDPAGSGYETAFLALLRVSGFWVSLVLLLWLVCLAWGVHPQKTQK